ncbi:MAG: hypothetical protein MJ123_05365 [Lachnospiraceae bacterium]|nr:hypothetical protein [Lachnospiraceae bacterium]
MKLKNAGGKWLGYLPCIIIALIALITTITYGFSFSSNDDGMLRAIASGAYTGKPSAHLIYIMYPLGLVLSCLYKILPFVSWYDLMMLFMHLWCWYLILSTVLKLGKTTGTKLVSVALGTFFLLAFDFKYLVLHQYTVLAALLVATAIFRLATLKKAGSGDICIIVIFSTLSLWLRKEAFLMGAPILFLAFIYKAFVCEKMKAKATNESVANDEENPMLKKLLLLALTIGLIAFLSFIVDALAYKSPSWKAFKEYNEARTQVYDYFKLPEYESYKDTYEGLGIEASEYEVLAHYLDVSLAEDVDTGKLTALADKYDDVMRQWQQFYSVPKKIIKDTALAIINNDVRIPALIMFLTCLAAAVLWGTKNAFSVLLIIAAYAYRIVFTAYFVSKGRFPERVSYGLFVIIALFALALICDLFGREEVFKETGKEKNKAVVKTALLLILIILSAVNLYKTSGQKKALDKGFGELESIYAYCNENAEKVYLMNTYSIAPYSEAMLTGSKLPKNYLVLGNWTSHSPLEKERMNRALVESFVKDLALDKNVNLIVKKSLGSDWLENYYKDKASTGTFDGELTITGNQKAGASLIETLKVEVTDSFATDLEEYLVLDVTFE